MGRQKRILLVSRDVRVLQTRKLMLGAYFDVYAAVRAGEAARFLAERRFDLIVLCYSLTKDDLQRILAAAETRSSSARILMVSQNGRSSGEITNAIEISLHEGPLALLKRYAELLGLEFRNRCRLIHALQPRQANEAPLERCA